MSTRPISGYIIDGGLAADLQAHFGEQTPHQDVAPSTDLEAFIADLPEPARAQLKAFDAVIREAKQWRDLDGFALHYGYDLAADGVEIDLDGQNVASKIFTLANDYGGNVFMMLPDGRVGIWSHDEGMVEDHTRFESLEQCLWTMVHCDLVKNQKIKLGPVKAVLEGFDEDTGPTWCLEELVEYLEDEGLL